MPIPEASKNKTVLEETFPVSIAETDCSGMVKPVVILNYMQDAAAKSISKYNSDFSCENLIKKGLGWFLIRYRLEFDDYPKNVQQVLVRTECRGALKMTTYRDFEVYDKSTGNRILRASSSWLIVDLADKSVVNISKAFPEFLKFEPREDDLTLQKLKSVEDFQCEKLFDVRFDDLDINNHVNNTVYISWALEALEYDFRLANRLKSLDIYFKHEAKYGDKISSVVKYDKLTNTTEHVIKNTHTGEELCLLKAEFTPV